MNKKCFYIAKQFLIIPDHSRQKYLGMNAGLWSSMGVWFWIFENFFEGFCEIVLIISGSTDYEFSAANLDLSKFWCGVFTIIMECLKADSKVWDSFW